MEDKFNKVIQDLIKLIPCDFYIAGGYAASEYFNIPIEKNQDIDIFFYTEEDFQEAHKKISNARTFFGSIKYDFEVQTDNAVTFTNLKTKISIQLICKKFGSPEEIFEGFDINKSKVAYFPRLKKFIASNDINGDLTTYSSTFNNQTLQRLHKYYTRGFSIDFDGVVQSFNELWESNKTIHFYYGDKENPVKFRDFIISDIEVESRELLSIFNKFFTQKHVDVFDPWIYERSLFKDLYIYDHLEKCYSTGCAGVKNNSTLSKRLYYGRMQIENPELIF